MPAASPARPQSVNLLSDGGSNGGDNGSGSDNGDDGDDGSDNGDNSNNESGNGDTATMGLTTAMTVVMGLTMAMATTMGLMSTWSFPHPSFLVFLNSQLPPRRVQQQMTVTGPTSYVANPVKRLISHY